jgi:hypothetical protein
MSNPVAGLADYEVRHLAAHLEVAGRSGDLFRLLDLETTEGRNAWHEAKAALDPGGSDYLADVALAWGSAERADTDAAGRDEAAPLLGREVRCALLSATLHSLTGNVPPELLSALVVNDLWSASQALTAVRQIPKPHRTDALRSLAPLLPSSLLGEALTLARELDEGSRSMALGALAPGLPEAERPPVFQETLKAARAMNSSDLAEMLRAIAPHLPEPLLREALEVVSGVPDEHDRMKALIALACSLPKPLLLTRALTLARAMKDESRRVEALAAVAAGLSEEERFAVLGEALDTVRAIKRRSGGNAWGREEGAATGALVALAPHLIESLAREALEVVRSIKSEFYRAQALAGLAAYLPGPRLGEALAMARMIDDKASRAEALAAVARRLPDLERPPVVREALALVGSLPRESRWYKIARTMAERLPVLDEMFEIPEPDEEHRAKVLVELAFALPESERLPVFREVLRAARAIEDEEERVEALSTFVLHLPKALLGEALALARAVRAPEQRALALSLLAPAVSEGERPLVIREALNTVQTIEDAELRPAIPAVLAPHVPRSLLDEALVATRGIADAGPRAETLAALAPLLLEPDRTHVLHKALGIARTIQSGSDRCQALVAIASQVPESERPSLLREALAVAGALGDDPERFVAIAQSAALEELAPRLPASLLREALAVAREIPDSQHRARALAALAPHLPQPLVSEALDLALEALPGVPGAQALLMLAARLPESELQSVLGDIFRRIRSVSTAGVALHEEERWTKALKALVPHLSVDLSREVLVLVREIRQPVPKVGALAIVAARLPKAERKRVLAEALALARSIRNGRKAEGLAAVAPLLGGQQRSQVLGEALDAARMAEHGWDCARTLAALAPHLPKPLQGKAVDVARAITGKWRAEALVALATHLPEAERPPILCEAFLAAPALDFAGERAGALASLASSRLRLSREQLYALWRSSLHALAVHPRPELLADLRALAPIEFALGGQEAIVESLHAIQAVSRWWP